MPGERRGFVHAVCLRSRGARIGRTPMPSGEIILLAINIVLLNITNRKLYNTYRPIPAWQAATGYRKAVGHLTGLPEFTLTACQTALHGRRGRGD